MKYVVIDLEALCLIGKVEGHIDACNLAYLCTPKGTPLTVQPIDTCCTMGNCFTQYSLGLLLKNITGADHSKYSLNQLTVIAIKVLQKCNDTDYSPSELLAQVQYKEHKGIEEGLEYVKGSRVPAKRQDGLICVRCDPLSNVDAIADQWLKERKELDQEGAKLAAVEREKVKVEPSIEIKERSPVATNSGRNGSSKANIWAVADQHWEAQGKPQDLKVVLAIRKEVMNVLENDYGIKKTSSSNELGKWQKERLN